MTCIAYGTSSS